MPFAPTSQPQWRRISRIQMEKVRYADRKKGRIHHSDWLKAGFWPELTKSHSFHTVTVGFFCCSSFFTPLGVLLWVPVSPGHHRLGGSALAQCYSQLGDVCPDLDRPEFLIACFTTTQKLIEGQSANTFKLSNTQMSTCKCLLWLSLPKVFFPNPNSSFISYNRTLTKLPPAGLVVYFTIQKAAIDFHQWFLEARVSVLFYYYKVEVFFPLCSDRLLSAGHDISDGGLISCLLEMAFAGNRGFDVELPSDGSGGEWMDLFWFSVIKHSASSGPYAAATFHRHSSAYNFTTGSIETNR